MHTRSQVALPPSELPLASAGGQKSPGQPCSHVRARRGDVGGQRSLDGLVWHVCVVATSLGQSLPQLPPMWVNMCVANN